MRHQHLTFLMHAGRCFMHPVDPTCSKRSIPFARTSLMKPWGSVTAPAPTSGLYGGASFKEKVPLQTVQLHKTLMLMQHLGETLWHCSWWLQQDQGFIPPLFTDTSTVFHCPCDSVWTLMTSFLGIYLLSNTTFLPQILQWFSLMWI